MRWTKEVETEPYWRHEIVESKFLLRPKCIKGDCRWMERATYVKKCDVNKRYQDDRWID